MWWCCKHKSCNVVDGGGGGGTAAAIEDGDINVGITEAFVACWWMVMAAVWGKNNSNKHIPFLKAIAFCFN